MASLVELRNDRQHLVRSKFIQILRFVENQNDGSFRRRQRFPDGGKRQFGRSTCGLAPGFRRT